ncbi:MAG: DUF1634 domain-containing protein [Ideonella sp.]|nr:DUF1634 domain-containing protein [Ideonella sp.]MCC7457598.1 hypothetical protein [Nitrospira sp.]
MTERAPPAAVQPPEQLRYAQVLVWGMRVGLAVLLLSFAAYALGLAESHVAPADLPQLWVHPVGRFVELTGSPTGWGWLALLHRGDIAGLLGIAILAGTSALCLLALLPIYLARRDRAFAAVCVAEIAVVALAASGWLQAAH